MDDLRRFIAQGIQKSIGEGKAYRNMQELKDVIKELGAAVPALRVQYTSARKGKSLELSQIRKGERGFNPTEALAVGVALGFRNRELQSFLEAAKNDYQERVRPGRNAFTGFDVDSADSAPIFERKMIDDYLLPVQQVFRSRNYEVVASASPDPVYVAVPRPRPAMPAANPSTVEKQPRTPQQMIEDGAKPEWFDPILNPHFSYKIEMQRRAIECATDHYIKLMQQQRTGELSSVSGSEAVGKIAFDLLFALVENSALKPSRKGITPSNRAAGFITPLHKAMGGTVPKDTLGDWIKNKYVTPHLLAINKSSDGIAAIDHLLANVVYDPTLRETVGNYLLGVPRKKTAQGETLIKWAAANDISRRDLFYIVRMAKRMKDSELPKALGITAGEYRIFVDGERINNNGVNISYRKTLDKIGASLGCDTPEAKRIFRQYALGIDLANTQAAFDRTFEDNAGNAVVIDPKATGSKRGDMLESFFKRLRDVHGFNNNGILARAITDDPTANTNHLPASVIEGQLETCRNDTRGYGVRRMDGECAAAVARFAYPHDEALRERCFLFLSGEQHSRIKDSDYRNRLAAQRHERFNGR